MEWSGGKSLNLLISRDGRRTGGSTVAGCRLGACYDLSTAKYRLKPTSNWLGSRVLTSGAKELCGVGALQIVVTSSASHLTSRCVIS